MKGGWEDGSGRIIDEAGISDKRLEGEGGKIRWGG